MHDNYISIVLWYNSIILQNIKDKKQLQETIAKMKVTEERLRDETTKVCL